MLFLSDSMLQPNIELCNISRSSSLLACLSFCLFISSHSGSSVGRLCLNILILIIQLLVERRRTVRVTKYNGIIRIIFQFYHLRYFQNAPRFPQGHQGDTNYRIFPFNSRVCCFYFYRISVVNSPAERTAGGLVQPGSEAVRVELVLTGQDQDLLVLLKPLQAEIIHW